MMELKSILIHRISEINDIRFLEAIKAILDAKAEDSTFELTDDQKKEIAESKEEIQKGLFVEEDDLDREIQQWLDGKLSGHTKQGSDI